MMNVVQPTRPLNHCNYSLQKNAGIKCEQQQQVRLRPTVVGYSMHREDISYDIIKHGMK